MVLVGDMKKNAMHFLISGKICTVFWISILKFKYLTNSNQAARLLVVWSLLYYAMTQFSVDKTKINKIFYLAKY